MCFFLTGESLLSYAAADITISMWHVGHKQQERERVDGLGERARSIGQAHAAYEASKFCEGCGIGTT